MLRRKYKNNYKIDSDSDSNSDNEDKKIVKKEKIIKRPKKEIVLEECDKKLITYYNNKKNEIKFNDDIDKKLLIQNKKDNFNFIIDNNKIISNKKINNNIEFLNLENNCDIFNCGKINDNYGVISINLNIYDYLKDFINDFEENNDINEDNLIECYEKFMNDIKYNIVCLDIRNNWDDNNKLNIYIEITGNRKLYINYILSFIKKYYSIEIQKIIIKRCLISDVYEKKENFVLYIFRDIENFIQKIKIPLLSFDEQYNFYKYDYLDNKYKDIILKNLITFNIE